MKSNFRVGRGVQNDPSKATKKRVKIKDTVGFKIVENCRTSFMDVPFSSMLMDVICVKHYEKKLTKNIRPTDILQIYTSI